MGFFVSNTSARPCPAQQPELLAQISDRHRTRQRVRDQILPEDRRAAQAGRQTHAAAAQEDGEEQCDRLEELQIGEPRERLSGGSDQNIIAISVRPVRERVHRKL